MGHPKNLKAGSLQNFHVFFAMYSGRVIRECITLYDRFHSFRKVSLLTGVSKSSIHRWWNSLSSIVFCKKTHRRRKKRTCRPRKYTSLLQDIRSIFNDSVCIVSLTDVLRILPYKPSLATLHRAFKKIGIIRSPIKQKVVSNSPEKMSEKVARFQQTFKEISSIDEIVCLDETGFCNIGNKLYGYRLPGSQHAMLTAPRRHRLSVMAAISTDGLITYTVSAKAFKSDSFLQFLEKLVPELLPCHKYLLMDNVSFHYNKAALAFLEARNIKPLYIPPYSPQFNPIEEVFSKVKREFRRQLANQVDFTSAVHIGIKSSKTPKGFTHPFYQHSLQFWSSDV
jgi:transposase